MTGPSPFQKEYPVEILQSIINTAIDGIILIEAWGTVVLMNPAVTRLFGYQAEEVIGQNVTLLMPSPHRELHHQYLKNYHDTGIKKIIGIGREIEQEKRWHTLPGQVSGQWK
jgi:PAS domain S-box-containing protein